MEISRGSIGAIATSGLSIRSSVPCFPDEVYCRAQGVREEEVGLQRGPVHVSELRLAQHLFDRPVRTRVVDGKVWLHVGGGG